MDKADRGESVRGGVVAEEGRGVEGKDGAPRGGGGGGGGVMWGWGWGGSEEPCTGLLMGPQETVGGTGGGER